MLPFKMDRIYARWCNTVLVMTFEVNCKPHVWKFNEVPERAILSSSMLAGIPKLLALCIDTLWKLSCISACSNPGFRIITFVTISFYFLSSWHIYIYNLKLYGNIPAEGREERWHAMTPPFQATGKSACFLETVTCEFVHMKFLLLVWTNLVQQEGNVKLSGFFSLILAAFVLKFKIWRELKIWKMMSVLLDISSCSPPISGP